MPTTESGYVSLETTGSDFRSVYNSTTEPTTDGKDSVIKSVKRAIGQAIGGGSANSSPSLIPENEYR